MLIYVRALRRVLTLDKDHWLYWLLLKKKGRAIVFVNAISCALRLVLFL